MWLHCDICGKKIYLHVYKYFIPLSRNSARWKYGFTALNKIIQLSDKLGVFEGVDLKGTLVLSKNFHASSQASLKSSKNYLEPSRGQCFAPELINTLYIFQMVPTGYRSAQEHKDLCIDVICVYEVLGRQQKPTYILCFPGIQEKGKNTIGDTRLSSLLRKRNKHVFQ